MADAQLYVRFAGPLVTLQDAGRPGHMRFGVPASGPMDRLSFAAAHAALGNPAGQTCVEVSLGGVELECREGDVTLAITGGEFVVNHNGRKSTGWTVVTLHTGDRISVRSGASGSWAYLACSGIIASDTWLDQSATHASSGFGGGALHAGQTLAVRDARVSPDREGAVAPYTQDVKDPFRVVIGPQEECFAPGVADVFTLETFKVSDAYDRMGMRLVGPGLTLNGSLSIPSEPIVRGSVQVSGDGVPTVLLADHQTTGGYPKIATVISCDIDRLVQTRAGQPIQFEAVPADRAIAIVRAEALARDLYLHDIGVPRGTLEQRLFRENLIHGVFDP